MKTIMFQFNISIPTIFTSLIIIIVKIIIIIIIIIIITITIIIRQFYGELDQEEERCNDDQPVVEESK